jgi:subtilisin family serine protease
LVLSLALIAALLPVSAPASVGLGDGFVHGEVLAPADSQEHAEMIAAVYGLELKSYAYGIAVIIAPDPEASISSSQRMRIAGIPRLSRNWIYTLYSGMEPYTYMRTVTTNGSGESVTRTYGDDYRPHAEPGSGEQWHHAEMDTEEAWTYSTGAGVIVAVIDTGIDVGHPAFAGRNSPISYNSETDQIGLAYVQDGHGHGTHVAGIIGAAAAGGNNIFGVAPDVEIMTIKANPGDEDIFYTDALLRGINYSVANGADIINMSLGRSFSYGEDALERSVIASAVASGVTVIAAAGNSRERTGFPAAYPEVIAVSSTRQGFSFDYSYSNFGPEIDVAAPGSDIYAPIIGGGYGDKTGTSMASPNVAGVAALVKSLHPSYTPEQIQSVLRGTAMEAGELGRDDWYGYGIVNAYAAVLGVDALHSVTYNFNDGERGPVTVKAAPGSRLIEPHPPLRDNFVFEFWSLSANGNAFDFSAVISNNITLYAQWIDAIPGMYAVEFPDPNFRREVLLLLNEQDGGNRTARDIMNSNDEAMLASIERLNVSHRNIRDMTGVSYFLGLTYLSAYFNQLTELDVSNNVALMMLDVFSNQLTTLDVSKNPALTWLYCENNQLTTLDVSKNPALIELYCSDNQLTTLDVSKNPALIELYCSGNQLTELDVSSNPALTWLLCDNNQLTTLDVSKNPVLSWLDCYNNQLTTLDVSNNPKLTYLDVSGNYLSGKSAIIGLDESRTSVVFDSQRTPPTTQFSISIAQLTGGTVTADLTAAAGGTVVTLTVTPDEGYQLKPGSLRYNGVRIRDNTFIMPVTDVIITAEFTSGVTVTGQVKSYNPKNATLLQLMQGGTEMYKTDIKAAAGEGPQTQPFTFEGVAPGVYTLVITKDAHTSFTINNFVVGEEDIDLTAHGRAEISIMTLRGGDLDKSNNINQDDLAILINSANYGRGVSAATNPLADLDGSGNINQDDLAILINSVNYGRGAVVLEF